MGKYEPLGQFLRKQRIQEVPLTFREIEKITGVKLPPKAQHHRAWWSNNPDNSVMTKAWLDAGFKTEAVDVPAETLVFRRVRDKQQSVETGLHGRLEEGPAAYSGARRHPGFGFMKGLIKIEEGFDVTKPFDDEAWDEGYLGDEEK